MTRPRNLALLVLVIAGALTALTYLLVPYAGPDAARHDRAFDALRALMLNEAALHRDLLRARAGLLRSYDPLVRSVEDLRRAVDTLRSDGRAAGSNRRVATDRHVDHVAAAVADQEALVEAFKSQSALLQNSLMFFRHVIEQFDRRQSAVMAEVGTLANAMLRFTSDPQAEIASDVMASLARLAQSPSGNAEPGIRELVSHGRLIVATLPTVDGLVSRILEASTTERAGALQDAFSEAHAEAVARASTLVVLLYIAALALLAYVGYLFLRLRANARSLQSRLDFEQLIAAISTQFINLPRDSIDDGVNNGLARLAEHAGVDRALIITYGNNGTDIKHSYSWRRPDIGALAWRLDEVLETALQWPFEGYERQGCIHVPDVQTLPDSAVKFHLRKCGIRSWLCIPMWSADRRVGFLTFDAVSARKHWPDEDIALSRTAGEILANAIERRRSESERETLEGRLHQAQRLETVGTLAGGIAHEFNNILGAIFGYAELALSTLGRGSRARRHVKRIMVAGERAQAVINQILTFSRRRERRPRLVEAAHAVAEAASSCAHRFLQRLPSRRRLMSAIPRFWPIRPNSSK